MWSIIDERGPSAGPTHETGMAARARPEALAETVGGEPTGLLVQGFYEDPGPDR